MYSRFGFITLFYSLVLGIEDLCCLLQALTKYSTDAMKEAKLFDLLSSVCRRVMPKIFNLTDAYLNSMHNFLILCYGEVPTPFGVFVQGSCAQ